MRERARILISLHSGEYDKPEIAVPAESLYDLVRSYARSDFIDNGNVYRNIGPECLACGGILEQAVENGERVRGYDRTNPLDDVTLVVIVGRLDQRQLKSSARWRGAKKHPVPLISGRRANYPPVRPLYTTSIGGDDSTAQPGWCLSLKSCRTQVARKEQKHLPHHAQAQHRRCPGQGLVRCEGREASIFEAEDGKYRLVARVQMEDWPKLVAVK